MVVFNNLTSSETDQVKHFVTTSVEEELGRRHRGVYWTGLSFAVSLEATTQREVEKHCTRSITDWSGVLKTGPVKWYPNTGFVKGLVKM